LLPRIEPQSLIGWGWNLNENVAGLAGRATTGARLAPAA